ncbi:MAG: GGDEF domain-containing protein, partial [Lachnospiraceae bacterium]|nr:GGDEF domain-containing protein [Lachnospiraceae bacterium]
MGKARKLIAFFGGMLDEEKNSSFIHEIEKECLKQGYLMLAFGFSETTNQNQDQNNSDLKLIEIAGQLDLCAIIMHLEYLKNDYLIDEITELGIKKAVPVIVMEKRMPGNICISMRYKEGFAETVRHVIDVHGCRKINMLAGPKGDFFSEERIESYKAVLAEKGIPFEPERLDYGDFWDKPARTAVRRFISKNLVPEAIVCANDSMALAVCDELMQLGYRVPEDIIVTGFDGVKSGLFNIPAITTVEPDYESEAAQVIELVKRYENQPNAEVNYDVNFVLRPRNSCGCFKSEDVLSPTDITMLSSSYNDVNWAVRRINLLLSKAAMLSSMTELSQVIVDTLWLNEADFQFAAVFSDILRPEIKTIGNHDFTTFFRCENYDRQGIGESYDEKDFIPGFDKLIRSDDISTLFVRLLFTGDKTFGYVVEGTRDTSNRDIRRCEEFSMFLSMAINAVLTNRDLADMHHKMERISAQDYLTGIKNRRGFYSELKKIVGKPSNKGKWITAFSIDMDNLKRINDFYGHAQGDFAIKSLASAIQRFSSTNGICARYGGDEFACVLLRDAPMDMSAEDVRIRLNTVLLASPEVRAKTYDITASVGSATAVINESLDIEKVLGEADQAMYEDKKRRKEAAAREAA